MTAETEPRRPRLASPWRVAGWGAAAALLLLPLVAMQFSDEVQWTLFDFVFAGGLMLVVGLAFEFLALRNGPAYRAGAAVALGACVLTIWINGAVGVIGDEDNPANLMFGGVLAVAVLGALVGRLRPNGMALAMTAAAAAQLVVAAVGLMGDLGAGGPIWPWDLVGVSLGFTVLWLAAAALFRWSAPAGQ